MLKTKLDTLLEKISEGFDDKFSVFDGSQKIIKHVTYSRWVKEFLHQAIMEAYQLGKKEGIEDTIKDYNKKLVHEFEEMNTRSDGLIMNGGQVRMLKHFLATNEKSYIEEARLSQLVEEKE